MAATIQTIHKPTRARGLDTSGNNNHAQIYSGRGLEFDGVTDYLECFTTLDTTHSFFTTPNQFTVSCWVKVNTIGDDTIWYATNTANTSRVGLNIGAEGEISFTTYNGTSYVHASGGGSDEEIIHTSTWYRVVCTCDNNTLKLYLNGILQTGTTTAHSGNLGSTNANRLRIGERNSIYFDGCLSDFQVWNSVFSQDDVTFDYLNPEQLALNRGGTSLTNSNLKLWYPMNEGHRGNQSYVLDASNTGIGDIMETTTGTTNAYMSEDTGWLTQGFDDGDTTIPVDGANEKAFYVTDKFVTGGRSLYFKTVSSDSNENIFAQYNFVAGTTYKFFARVWAIDQGTGQYPVLYQSDSRFKNGVSKIATAYGEWQELEMILTCDSSGIGNNQIGGSGGGKTLEFYIDEFWVKPINDKHNATTVFYGDDLFDAGVGDYGDSTGAWAAEGGNGLANDSSALKITYVNNDDGAKLFLKDDADLKEDLVVGRNYRLTFTYKVNQVSGQNFIAQINTGDNATFKSTGRLDQTSFTTLTKDFIATHATNANVRFNNMSSGDILHVKDFKLEEVGVATGWTAADQQLDIPQTALQSYNQLAWPHGASNHQVNIADGDSDMKFTTGDFSISFWFMPNSDTLDGYVLSKGAYHTSGYYIYYDGSTQKVYYQTNQSSAGQANNSRALTLGKWHHCVVTIKDSGTDSTWYINGQVDEVKTNHTAPTADTRNLQLYNRGGGSGNSNFGLTELSFWNKTLSLTEVEEIYNNGVALDATTHSASSDLLHYWKNNGLGTWIDRGNAGSLYNGTTANITKTMFITAGVDSSRDSQGFLMNRQRLTNTLNLPIIDFANNEDVISSNDVEVIDPSLTYSDTGFSVECWFKAAMLGETGFIITHQESSNSGEGFHIRWASANTIYAVVSDGTNEANAQVSGALNADQWYHIVASWDHSNKKKYVYIDGILRQVETESSMGTIAPNADIHIGSRRGGGSQMFTGQIDDFKLYNRILTDGGVTTGQSDGYGLSIAVKGEVLRNYKAGKRSHK